MISSVEALVEIGAILLFLIPFLAGAAYAMANGAYKKKLEDRTASLLDGLSKSELFSWEQRRSEHLKSQESRREEFEKSETTRLEGLEKLFLGDLDEIQAELKLKEIGTRRAFSELLVEAYDLLDYLAGFLVLEW